MDNPARSHYPDQTTAPGGTGNDMREQRRQGRDSPVPAEDAIRETLSRARRIETRLTQLLIGLGVSTESQKPEFKAGRLQLPSRHTSMQEIIDSIPKNWPDPVGVFIGNDQVAVIDRLGNRSS